MSLVTNTQLWDDLEFNKLPGFPDHMKAIGMFTYLRTYSRFLESEGRRENWRETTQRSTMYNIRLALRHLQENDIPYDEEFYKTELDLMRTNIYNLKQLLSGRTMWVGGASNGVANKFPLANFNCSFTNIEEWTDLYELFYLLLVGTGAGFKPTKEMVALMPPIRKDVVVTNVPYQVKHKDFREEGTSLRFREDRTVATIVVGDSKEGWTDALRAYFSLLTNQTYSEMREIVFDYNNIRPEGEKLKTFGGTASGHEPLRDMFVGFQKVLNNEVDPTLEPLEHVGAGYYKVRPIHIMDIANMIGYNVVVGGVRRTSEIDLIDADDWESIFAKFGINGYWKESDFEKLNEVIVLLDELKIPYPARIRSYLIKNYDEKINGDKPFNFGSGLDHRRMSNNSIAFIEKPKREYLHVIRKIMELEGEPAFINLYELARRRLVAMGNKFPTVAEIKRAARKLGTNPCGEILLQSKAVCNLTTVNVAAFVENGMLNITKLIEAQKLSARMGLRMTLVELELEAWDKVQKTDRLLGCSLTGWQNAMAAAGINEYNEKSLLKLLGKVAREEAERYAKELRVVCPLLVTTVKPEGTGTLVVGAGSSGLHAAYAPYYIRRIRISATDALAKAALEHNGWIIHAEVGTYYEGVKMETEEDLLRPEVIAVAKTLVISFPEKSNSKVTGDDLSAITQLDNYFSFQENYTDHNSSNTIRVKPEEWDAVEEKVYENWDNFVGVSFLAHDGGTYKLTPYEAIDEELYEEMKDKMEKFSMDKLQKHETTGEQDLDAGCDTGACPTR